MFGWLKAKYLVAMGALYGFMGAAHAQLSAATDPGTGAAIGVDTDGSETGLYEAKAAVEYYLNDIAIPLALTIVAAFVVIALFFGFKDKVRGV